MNIKQNNFKVAVFAVSCIALSVVTVNAVNPIINGNKEHGNSAYAAEAKRIDTINATGSIQVLNQGKTSITTTSQVDVDINNASNIASGDYITFSFDNLATTSLAGREIRFNDVIVGRFENVSTRTIDLQKRMITSNKANIEQMNPSQEINSDSVWKLVFNNKASEFDSMKISFNIANTQNHTVYSSKPINFTHSISVNDQKIAENRSQTQGIALIKPTNSSSFAAFYGRSIDGEEITGNLFDFSLRTKGGAEGIQPGDIVELTLSSTSGVAFDTTRNPKFGVTTSVNTLELWDNYGDNVASNGLLFRDGTPLKYKVLENSSHRLRYQIVEISKTPSLYQLLPRLSILDTSPKTINYANQSFNELTASSRIVRNGKEILSSNKTVGGSIEGARLKAYDQIKKRGSVIVKYVDESGELLTEEILLHNKVQEGTKYSAEEKTFDGFKFKQMGESSASKEGDVEEGVKNIVFVYSKIELPGDNQNTDDTSGLSENDVSFDKVKAPNTGFSSGISAATISILSLLSLATFFIRKK